MRDFHCPNCASRLAFENSVCLTCGSSLGFDLDSRGFVLVGADGTATGSAGSPAIAAAGGESAELAGRHMCANLAAAACNWLAPVGIEYCRSCALTRTRPGPDDLAAMAEFAKAETAKRRLVLELTELTLPIVGREADPAAGVCFDLLSSRQVAVTTGHADGVITLDLAEGDDAHREQLRVSMDEPYRTLLGHFRHEIGHYYYPVLVGENSATALAQRAEKLFGDPELDYQQALDRHYSQGPPADWESEFVSSYATMHPSEDWAETFAHYLHIRDTLDTAAAFGIAPAEAAFSAGSSLSLEQIVEWWLPLTWLLNMINRSMGHPDLYPFVLPPAVLEKMRLVHEIVSG